MNKRSSYFTAVSNVIHIYYYFRGKIYNTHGIPTHPPIVPIGCLGWHHLWPRLKTTWGGTVELVFSYKRRELHYSLAVQEEMLSRCRTTVAFYYKRRELQPGCTRGSAARLYQQEEVQPGWRTSLLLYETESTLQPGCTRGSAVKLNKKKCSRAVPTRRAARLYQQEEEQPGCINKKKCSQAVQTRWSAARLYKQEEVQPGCTDKRKCSQAVQTRGSAARLYRQEEVQPGCTNKRKCSQAVQEEVQPGCGVELPSTRKGNCSSLLL